MISPRLKNFFALGFGIERGTNTDLVCYWPTLHLKLFMGFWVGNWTFRIGRKLKH